MTACVPCRSGAYGSSTTTLIAAWLSSVSSISRTEPTRRPPTWTSSSVTSWPAFWKIRVYSVPPSAAEQEQPHGQSHGQGQGAGRGHPCHAHR